MNRATKPELEQIARDAADGLIAAWTELDATRCAMPFLLPLSLAFIMGVATGCAVWWLW